MIGTASAGAPGYEAERLGEVWIVDDDQSIRWVLERALAKEGYQVRCFPSTRNVLDALETGTPDVLVSDIRMPGESGIDLLYQLRQKRPQMPVIIMTAYSDLESAVSAFQGGAFEYLPKPFDLGQAIDLIRRAMAESDRHTEPEEAAPGTQDMLGQAPSMQEVFRAIGRLSQSSVTVLVTGESGTGKELIARALHRHSARAAKPFVALNMAAIPRDLLESELFGHERGSFTGAQQQRRGRFEQADGGTLFLDEIGDMPPEMQTRLLRVLSEGHYYRVGGHQPIKSNVRVIAATHQNLEDRVQRGLFREDLFHRLNVIRLRLPPLRERIEDIGLLARHFLTKSAADLGVETKRLSSQAIDKLAGCEWPGNVRQLENVCNWLTVMAPTQLISVKDLPPEILNAPPRARTADAGAESTLVGGLAVSPGTVVVAAPGAATHGSASPAASESVRGWASDGASRTADTMPVFADGGHGESVHHGPVGQAGQGQAGSPGAGYPQPAGYRADAGRGSPAPVPESNWAELLSREASRKLADARDDALPPAGQGLMDKLTREFEATLIRAALAHTRGRRVEAAQRLGIGRNTITRKIQELGLDD